MKIFIVYDEAEEAAAGVLLGFNALKTAKHMKNIQQGTTSENGLQFFQLDTSPIKSTKGLTKGKLLPSPAPPNFFKGKKLF